MHNHVNVYIMLFYICIQAELGRVKGQLSTKEEELKRMKRQAESDKKVAQEESKSNQSEIGHLKRDVQSLTETQRKLETKNKVRVHCSSRIDIITHLIS
jgi:Skp family chaperone for outer membrane proteins